MTVTSPRYDGSDRDVGIAQLPLAATCTGVSGTMVGMRRRLLALAVAGCALTTAACGSAGGSTPPTWQPSPAGPASEGPGVSISPILPQPPQLSGGGGGSTSPGASSRPGSSSPASQVDPDVVATHLTTPTGLALLPDGTALVGERTTGRIVRVQPVAGRPTPVVKTLSGLDTADGGGLLDLAVSPDYSQDNLVYALVSTAKDNRVVDFTLGGPVTPVLTGIPHGRTGNSGRIEFDADGNLLVGTGTAGSRTAAADPNSLAGKVLRVDSIGSPVAGNVRRGSSVYTLGNAGLAGLCPAPAQGSVLEVAAGTSRGVVNRLVARARYDYPAHAGARPPLATLPVATPGDCAVQAGRLWVTSPDGRTLLNAALTGGAGAEKLGAFTKVLANTYGRLLTVVPAADGALWLTTTNRDGHGKPVAADERVIRYVPSGGGGGGSSV